MLSSLVVKFFLITVKVENKDNKLINENFHNGILLFAMDIKTQSMKSIAHVLLIICISSPNLMNAQIHAEFSFPTFRQLPCNDTIVYHELESI